MDFPGNTSDPEKSRIYLCRVLLFNVLLLSWWEMFCPLSVTGWDAS
jgi:hypothetical protein